MALYYATARYGKMRLYGTFRTSNRSIPRRTPVLLRTDRGRELGELVRNLELAPQDLRPDSCGEILRCLTSEDHSKLEAIHDKERGEQAAFCQEQIRALSLEMKLIDIENLFGSEKIIIYFTAERRVDFRELVKRLAHQFKSRIELRQIGPRDVAKLTGDVGHCGTPLCCQGHVTRLGGISMRMAKIQKSVLDPTKISGCCGQLLCCLKYEYGLYLEAREGMPPRGSKVETKRGTGVVIGRNVIQKQLSVELEDGTIVICDLMEISISQT